MSLFSFLKKPSKPHVAQAVDDEALSCAALTMRELLHAAGCEVKTIRAAYTDETEKTALLYFLVPAHRDTANFGWFTDIELKDWSFGRGIVPRDDLLDRMDGLNEYTRKADKMLEEAGVRVLGKSLAVWVVAESRLPGVRVLTHPADEELLPTGSYTLHQLSVMLSLDSGEVVDEQSEAE